MATNSSAVARRLLLWVLLTQSWTLALGQSGLAKLIHSSSAVLAASVVDPSGNVYIAGYTYDDVIPTTFSAFQRQFKATACPGGFLEKCAHSFLMKISADGARILYATYLGGNGSDLARSMVIDSSGSAYIAGTTTSPDFPVSATAFQRTPGPGFIARISPDGTSLLASTYLNAKPSSLAIDSAGNVFAAGEVGTDAFVTTLGAFQTVPQGNNDAFVLKMDGALEKLLYSTRLGGAQGDSVLALTVDGQGAAYVCGQTFSNAVSGSPFPTPGAYAGVSGPAGSFVAKLSPDGSRLIFAATIGIYAHEIVVDPSGSVYAAGDGAVRLSADGSRLISSTPLPDYYTDPPLSTHGLMLINTDHLLFWDYGNSVPTNPDSSSPCPRAFQTPEPYLIELNSALSSAIYATYLPDVLAVNAEYVWSTSRDPSKLIDRMPLHGFGTPAITCIASSATLANGLAAPGELVALFGPEIGPDQPASLQLDVSGKVSTRLGGISVLWNGVASPLVYVSKNQINAVVPFEVAGMQTATVTILKNGVAPPPLEIPIVAVVPAVYQVGEFYAVVNQDGTLNTGTNPAPLGSVITLYGTGAGAMNPGASTGSLGDGTHLVALPVTARIETRFGSRLTVTPATVPYAGDAPTLVQGVVVLQVKIPDEVPGVGTTLVISVGSAAVSLPIHVR